MSNDGHWLFRGVSGGTRKVAEPASVDLPDLSIDTDRAKREAKGEPAPDVLKIDSPFDDSGAARKGHAPPERDESGIPFFLRRNKTWQRFDSWMKQGSLIPDEEAIKEGHPRFRG